MAVDASSSSKVPRRLVEVASTWSLDQVVGGLPPQSAAAHAAGEGVLAGLNALWLVREREIERVPSGSNDSLRAPESSWNSEETRYGELAELPVTHPPSGGTSSVRRCRRDAIAVPRYV